MGRSRRCSDALSLCPAPASDGGNDSDDDGDSDHDDDVITGVITGVGTQTLDTLFSCSVPVSSSSGR